MKQRVITVLFTACLTQNYISSASTRREQKSSKDVQKERQGATRTLIPGRHKEGVRGLHTNNADLDIKSDKGETKRVGGGDDPLRKCGGVEMVCWGGGGVKSPSGVVSH